MKRMSLVGCVWAAAWFAVACGGSSSETPFPQAPVEPGLEQRHEAAFAAEHGGDQPAVTNERAAPDEPAVPNEPVTSTTAASAPADGAKTGSSK